MDALTIYLASSRGFCAGVVRAIDIVERALDIWGAPVYVRHEIVHNPQVVRRLTALGAVFVETLADCPDDRPVIFSAHGVPRSVVEAAQHRKMTYVDAVCPLVSKVHNQARRHADAGRFVFLVGHRGHPEVDGTLGQIPPHCAALIETVADAQNASIPDHVSGVAYVTQTTLSVDDTARIIAVLRHRFPDIIAPGREDICYATTNRQRSVTDISVLSDLVLIVGATNSSNSLRLVEVARRAGNCPAYLIGSANDIHWTWLDNVSTLGLSAGASAPASLIDQVISACRQRFDVKIAHSPLIPENMSFRLPRIIESPAHHPASSPQPEPPQ